MCVQFKNHHHHHHPD
ncbi:MAG: his operon leader peptide [Kluyvera sp.]